MWLVLLLVINYVMARTIHYECETNENCSTLVQNSVCLNKKCICQLGYKSDGISQCLYESRYRRHIGFGVRMLGEDCESNDECRRTPVDGTKGCLVNQCQCSSGYVPIDAYRCIRDIEQLSSNTRVTKSSEIEPRGYGSICSTNPDCQHFTVQLECLRGTCVCLEGYVPLGKYLCYNIRGQDAPIIESSIITTTFSTTSTFDSPKDQMVKSLGGLGNTCADDYYCRRTVSQSHCYNGKCTCMNGYISLDGYTCSEDLNQDVTTIVSANHKSLLGGKCLTNENCQKSDGRCVNNICICPNGYFPIDDWNCLQDPDSPHETSTQTPTILTTTTFRWWPWSPSSSKTPPQSLIDSKNTFRFRCLLNRQCASIDTNSHCTLYGRCVCNLNYKLEITNTEQQCIRQIINEDDCD